MKMNKILVPIATLVLFGIQAPVLAGSPAEMAETCIDCHDVEEFEGMDAAMIVSKSAEGSANSKMMAKATADISAADLQKIAEYLAESANP
jgi:cytochrome c553